MLAVVGQRLATLLLAIRENPSDRDLRLVYADALEEEGEALRAEVIRLAIRGDPRADVLAREQSVALAGPVIAAHANAWGFMDGLVGAIDASLAVWAEHGRDLLRSAPCVEAELGDDASHEPTREDAERIASIPELRQLRTALFDIEELPPDVLATFLASPHLSALRTLRVDHGGASEVARVISSARVPSLRELLLFMADGPGDEAALHLASSENLSELTHLALSCPATDAAVLTMAASPYLGSLETLALSGRSATKLTLAATTALARWKHAGRLRSLELRGFLLDEATLAPLLSAPGLALESLSLTANTLTSVEPLLAAPASARLRRLSLAINHLDDRALEAILKWPNVASLERIDVSGNPRMTEAALRSFRDAPSLARCQVVIGPDA